MTCYFIVYIYIHTLGSSVDYVSFNFIQFESEKNLSSNLFIKSDNLTQIQSAKYKYNSHLYI